MVLSDKSSYPWLCVHGCCWSHPYPDPHAPGALFAPQSQADQHAASQVAAALGRLVAAPDGPTGAGSAHAVAAAAAAAGGAFDLGRLSRRAFRERVCAVVSELRGIMRVR